jgi:hypothetical protein
MYGDGIFGNMRRRMDADMGRRFAFVIFRKRQRMTASKDLEGEA